MDAQTDKSVQELLEEFREASEGMDASVLGGLIEGTVDAFTDKARSIQKLIKNMPAKARMRLMA